MPKYQQGGGFESLFTIYKPIQTETPRRAAASSRKSESKEKDDSDKGKLTEKDLFSMLKDLDGLPNEMQTLVSSLTNTLRIARITGQDDINDLATTYLTNLYKLKQAKYNRDLFKETYDRAVENNSLNDIAITLNGSVLALDKDQKIVAMKPEEWVQAKQSGEYQALTNSNLLWYRSQHPEYVNNNKVLQIVENGIGLETVHKMIKDRFRDLGKTETGSETFIPKDAAKGQQILEQMLQLGPEGYYKISTDLTQTDQRQVEATLAYIYNTLPANARTRLALETADGSQKSAQSIIGAMIFGTLGSKTKYSAQYIGTDEKLSGKGKKSVLGDIDGTTPAMFLAGLGDKQSFIINAGTSSSFMIQSNTLPLTDSNDKPLGVQTTLQKVSEGRYSGILDFRSVTMGGQLVDPMAFGKVVVSDGKITSVDFPCENVNGVIIPKLSPDIVNRKQKADQEIRSKGINISDKRSIATNYQVINQIYQNNGLTPAYDANGDPIQGSWARFGVANGVAGNTALDLDPFSGSQLLQEDTNDFHIQSYMEVTKTEEWDKKDKWKIFEGNADVLYRGTIWIPLRVDYVSAYTGQSISMGEAMDLDTRTQALNTANQLTLGRQPK